MTTASLENVDGLKVHTLLDISRIPLRTVQDEEVYIYLLRSNMGLKDVVFIVDVIVLPIIEVDASIVFISTLIPNVNVGKETRLIKVKKVIILIVQEGNFT